MVNRLKLSRLIDHTLLRPEAIPDEIIKLCSEAVEHAFYSACVNTHYVALASRELDGTDIKVCSIAGFPLGACESSVKVFEAKRAVEQGAGEIDMVLNIGALKAGDYGFVHDDIAGVVEACDQAGLKVIIEAALLSDEEKVRACRIAMDAGAGFVKTSTGFGPPGATVRDVEIMRGAVGPDYGVKASAGIRTAGFAVELVKAGASRIGTSAGVRIMKEFAELQAE